MLPSLLMLWYANCPLCREGKNVLGDEQQGDYVQEYGDLLALAAGQLDEGVGDEAEAGCRIYRMA